MIRRGIELLSSADVINKPAITAPDVVEGLLYRGQTSLLVSSPKRGKSKLIRTMALDVSRGDPFLGRKTTAGNVIVLSVEDTFEYAKAELLTLGIKGSDRVQWHFGHVTAPIEGQLYVLEQLIMAHDVQLCVVDTLGRFFKITELNDYTAVLEHIEKLIMLAARTKTHIMMTHHASKTKGRSGGEAAIGSQGLTGSVDTIMFLNERRVLSSQQRYGEPIEGLKLVMDQKSGRITGEPAKKPGSVSAIGAAGNKIRLTLQQCYSEVIQLLLQHSRVSDGDVAVQLSMTVRTAKRVMDKMVDDGLVLVAVPGGRNGPSQYQMNWMNPKTAPLVAVAQSAPGSAAAPLNTP